VAPKNIIGIDHAVVMVKDLDKAAENWKRLGFTLSPRGTHSAYLGSGDYTIMFDPDYMELLRRPDCYRVGVTALEQECKSMSL
jgi:hypothetical protein